MSTIAATLRTIVLIPLFFIGTLLAGAYVAIVGHMRRDTPHIDNVILAWSRVFLGLPPIRYEASGGVELERDQIYVVVSNHLSNFDIPLLFLTLPVKGRFLAKKELYRIPLVAQAMDVVGIVKIDRQGGMSAHQAINAGVKEARTRGFSLIVFPEGTRSRTGEMAEFKKGAFRIAIDNQLPLLPAVIDGTWDANPPGKWLIRPAQARVRLLPPIDTVDMTVKNDATALMKDTREKMLEVYEEMRLSRSAPQS